jgi:hypothetical protein
VVAAEVLEAARQGQFGALTGLTDAYSHVALFQNGDTTAAWQQLMQPAAAAAPASQQQAGGSSLQLCKASGLGSYKQQVWLLSSQPQPGQQASALLSAAAAAGSSPGDDDDEFDPLAVQLLAAQQQQQQQQQAAALTPEQRAQQLKVLPNLGYACLCSTMRKYEVFASRVSD